MDGCSKKLKAFCPSGIKTKKKRKRKGTKKGTRVRVVATAENICSFPSEYFSIIQSLCSRISVVLLSYDWRSTPIRLDGIKKSGRVVHKPTLSSHNFSLSPGRKERKKEKFFGHLFSVSPFISGEMYFSSPVGLKVYD